jgi:hypothetical protein
MSFLQKSVVGASSDALGRICTSVMSLLRMQYQGTDRFPGRYVRWMLRDLADIRKTLLLVANVPGCRFVRSPGRIVERWR